MALVREVSEAASNARQKAGRKLRWPVSEILIAPARRTWTLATWKMCSKARPTPRKPSNTGPSFRRGSAPSRTQGLFVSDSLTGTTPASHHSGIALLTPDAVHQGQAEKICQTRKITLTRAYLKHPERFVNGQPEPPKLPDKVWINPPQIPEKSVPVYTNFKPGVSQNA